MKNRVCQLLGIDFPVIEGGLAYVGNGLLAAAVSEAGGLGQIASGGRLAAEFRQEIEIALSHTNKPLSVNIPLSEHRDSGEYFAVVEEFAHRLAAISLSAGNPRPYIPRLKAMGLTVMTLASTPAQAQKAEDSGADLVICEGYEAGGHNGPAEITSLVLIPAVKDVVTIPVVAAGGIAEGRTAAAMFFLGAEGVQLGTRFVATTECQAHGDYKAALVAGRAEDTVVMERSLGRVTRVLKSPFVHKVLQLEHSENPSAVLPLISGRNNYRAARQGDLAEGWVNCGQSVELVHEIVPAAEVIQRLMNGVYAALPDFCLG